MTRRATVIEGKWLLTRDSQMNKLLGYFRRSMSGVCIWPPRPTIHETG